MGKVPEFCGNISSINNETLYEILSECWHEKWIADTLRKTLPLIILPVSLICNILSFIALQSRHMRGTSTAFFMLALSVLDPLVLLTKNLVYFPTFVVAHGTSCKVLYFFIYVLGYTNVWILVIMTADKYFAVWFPLRVSDFCTINRAKYACVLIVAMTSIISFHHFWTIDSLTHPKDSTQRFCYYDMNRYPSIQRVWRYVDFVIWCFLPFILILTLSVLIISKLRRNGQSSRKDIHKVLEKNCTSELTPSGTPMNKKKQEKAKKSLTQDFEIRSTQKAEVIRSRHRHITLMLLAVAVVFLLLTLPNSVYFLLDITYGFNKLPTENNYHQWLRYRRLTILTVIMFQLSDLQHATNFFLYLLTSDKFRRSVVRICITIIPILPSLLPCCFRNKAHSSEAVMSPSYLVQRKGKEPLSLRTSISDRSSMQLSTQCVSNRPTQQPLLTCAPRSSKSLTVANDSLV